MPDPGGPTESTRREFVRNALAAGAAAALVPAFSAPARGETSSAVEARAASGALVLANDAIAARWEAGPGLRLVRVEDRRNRRTLEARLGAFAVALEGGVLLDAARLEPSGPPRVMELPADPAATRLAERFAGRELVVTLGDPAGRACFEWRAQLREGSHYVRQLLRIQAAGSDVPIAQVVLVDLDARGAAVQGTVKGSPATAGDWFFGFEHPLSESTVGHRIRCRLERTLPLPAGQSVVYSSVIGVCQSGQMRRDFLAYVERERARPYGTFLHYNSWYDLGYFTQFDEASALAVIEAFGRELHEKRGVTLDSCLFDDGWDDRRFWGFHAGLPRGFAPLTEALARYGSAPGVWLSPWGGYGKPRQERLAFARENGFETNEDGLALSGPVYYRRFREVCFEFLRRYGVNQFKFDGTGSSSRVFPGSRFGSDFDAAIALISDLRAEKPGLFVNLTTGTYPSPWWLRYADSIWRGGEDHEFEGAGSDRQRWITYRDAATFERVVQTGPLYPLNSLMLHGVIYARHARGLDSDPAGDLASEIHSYFGSGTQLQELYVTPAFLSPSDWDTLAEAARWSRVNAATLRDTHWIGGDPARREVYGWGAWSPGRGIVTLRNPDERAQTFALEIGSAWELPEGAPRRYRARSPWTADRRRSEIALKSGKPVTLTLSPFEVRTLEATV